MRVKVVSPPTLEPVTLMQAKAHLRVDSSDDDALITRLIESAREHVENVTRRSYIQRVYRMTMDEFDEVELPFPPAISVSSITYKDANGATQTLSTSVYEVATDSELYPGIVRLAYNQEWPETLDQPGAVTITWTAGYGSSGSPTDLGQDDIPEAVKQAILIVLGDLYENREARTDLAKYRNPTVDRLLAPYTCYTL